MSYAIISVGGKQYRVREGEHLLVDRLPLADGESFKPSVLLVGGTGTTALSPGEVVTAKVVGAEKGPKLVIGKYKKRTGYKRHTGFRASLTRIQIESIGGTAKRAPAKQESVAGSDAAPKPTRARTTKPKAAAAKPAAKADETPKPRRSRAKKVEGDA
jgi:large subunit ribosomal protein L21